MTIAKISRVGLAAIATLVSLLWGCLVLERLTVIQANQDIQQALHKMQLLRIRASRPLSMPRTGSAARG